MSDVDKAGQYQLAEQLLSEQNIVNGTVAAAVASFAGALAWGAITVATGYMIGWVAIGVGFAVGYGMQVFGKGLDARFSVIAAVLAIIGCAVGNLVGALIFEARTYDVPIQNILGALTLEDIIAFYAETLEIMDFVFWLFAMAAAWQVASRKLTPEEAGALHEYRNRPEGGMIQS